MWTYIFLAVALPAIVLGHGIVPCPGGLPTPTALRIEGCPSAPCHVYAGDEIAFESDLVANAASATLIQEVEMTALGQTTPFPLPPEMANVCNSLAPGHSCPVALGQQITHVGYFPVITELHGGIPVQLRSRIYNANGSAMSCSIINAVIH